MKSLQNSILTIATFCIFLQLLLGFLHPITAINQDLGRHLLLGKIIAQTHLVPKIIQQFQINQQTAIVKQSNTYEDLIHYLYFFEKVGWEKKIVETRTLLSKRQDLNTKQKLQIKRE